MCSAGETPKDRIRNSGYAISLARKLGAEIFLLPHDIVEVKPKMILLLVGSLMSLQTLREEEQKAAGGSAIDDLGKNISYSKDSALSK